MTFIAFARDLEKENARRNHHYIDYARSLEKQKQRSKLHKKPDPFVIERSVAGGEWTPFQMTYSRQNALSMVEDESDPDVRYRCSSL